MDAGSSWLAVSFAVLTLLAGVGKNGPNMQLLVGFCHCWNCLCHLTSNGSELRTMFGQVMLCQLVGIVHLLPDCLAEVHCAPGTVWTFGLWIRIWIAARLGTE